MRNFKYKPKADTSFDEIDAEIIKEVNALSKAEHQDKIEKNPLITKVDYRSENKKIPLAENKKTASGYDPWSLYQHVTSEGVISEKPTGASRKELVEEIDLDGNSSFSTREQFEKKIEGQKISETSKNELYQLTRITSKDTAAYKNSALRSKQAIEEFDRDKYKIEKKSAVIGVPPSAVSALLYKNSVDTGGQSMKIDPSYARLSYKRVYGSEPPWDDAVLSNYLNTREGQIEFTALCLKGEALYRKYDVKSLSQKQLCEILDSFCTWNGLEDTFGNESYQFYNTFRKIYQNLPGEEFDITIAEE